MAVSAETTSRTDTRQIAALHRCLLDWYAQNARSFGWRTRQNDAYLVLVAEVMLQQTQTARVEIKLPQFLERFPTVYELAAADNATIVRAWQGMGYNNRAIRLRDCARAIIERHKGHVPETMEELLALPGIGRYTASAILVFAYGRDLPVVDVNIQRVYSRLFGRMATTAETLSEKETHDLALQLYPVGKSSVWHQALMDMGALYCTARAPKCAVCPLNDLCRSAFAMAEAQRQKRPEPSWRGEPNRIWRGRVVEILRGSASGQWTNSAQILARLFTGEVFTDEEETEMRAWLHGLAEGLRRDRLVEVRSAAVSQWAELRLEQ